MSKPASKTSKATTRSSTKSSATQTDAATPTESATEPPTGATDAASGTNPEPAATDAHDTPVAPTKANTGTKARKASKTRAPKEPKADLVVFAIRVEQAERDAIHKAAGPGKATRFVRTLAVAAAKGDVATVTAITEAVRDQLAK